MLSKTLEPVTEFPEHYDISDKHVIVYACDISYFLRGIQFHIATKKYWHPEYQLIIFVLSDGRPQQELDSMKREAVSAGILVYTFTCPDLIFDNSVPTNKSVLINYLKSARYSLALMILSRCPRITRVIVQDYDTIILRGFTDSLESTLQNNEILLTWDSSKTSSKDFPASLNLIHKGSVSQPYLAVKAGFTVFHNTEASHLFLRLFKFYALGPKQEARRRRLFNFYYGDQLALFYTAQTFKSNFHEYFSKIRWGDYSASELIGNEVTAPKHFFYPKGRSSFSAIEDVLSCCK